MVLLTELDNPLPEGIIGPDAGRRRFAEKLPGGLVPELMAELPEAPDGIAKARGDFSTGEAIDEKSPQGLVLAVGRVVRLQKDLSQVH